MAVFNSYPLVICYIAMEAMALIEIDGLPFLIAWWIFPLERIKRWLMLVVPRLVGAAFDDRRRQPIPKKKRCMTQPTGPEKS